MAKKWQKNAGPFFLGHLTWNRPVVGGRGGEVVGVAVLSKFYVLIVILCMLLPADK